MKKILSLVLALALLCAACVSLAENAETPESEGTVVIQDGYRFHQSNLEEPGHPFSAGFYLVDAAVFPDRGDPATDTDDWVAATVYMLYDTEKVSESPVSQWNLYADGALLTELLPVETDPPAEGYVLASVTYISNRPGPLDAKVFELIPVGTDGKEMQEKVVLEYGHTVPIGYVIDIRMSHE